MFVGVEAYGFYERIFAERCYA